MTMSMRLITCPACRGHRRFAVRPKVYIPCGVCRGAGKVVAEDIEVTAFDKVMAAEQVKDEFIKRSQYGG
jgi:hypothetical protein